MNDEERIKYEKELLRDEAYVMEEVNNNPDLKSVTAPPEIHENLFNRIHAREDGTYKRLTDRETELIRLGRIYEKKRKNRKYLALVAVMVLAMAFGITSFGSAEKIFEKFKITFIGRNQEQINSSEDVDVVDYVDEEAVYEEIEKQYGFVPIKLEYLPEGVGFQEATFGDEIQGIHLIYGMGEDANISYWVRPNYQISSWGYDIEDELLEAYQVEHENTQIDVRKYKVYDTEVRWSVKFEYLDASYSLLIMGVDEGEVEKIVNNLYFP